MPLQPGRTPDPCPRRRSSAALTSLVSTTALGCLLSVAVSNQAAHEWYQWRGPNRDGKSEEIGLLKAWGPDGPPLAWRVGGAGTGYSSLSASDGRLFTMGARGDVEYVMAFDARSGQKLWETPHGRRYANYEGDGPRGTPTVDGRHVYALGASGDLSCLQVETGAVVWSFNLPQRFRSVNNPWGISESPLVLDDRVLVNAGGKAASIVALDKSDGSVIWTNLNDMAGYSSAVVHRIGDITAAVFFTEERALGVDVSDGRLLWSYDRVSNFTANVATPIVRGNRVFVSSDYGRGGALLELTPTADGLRSDEVYLNRNMRNHHSSAVLVGDYLYGFSGSALTAMSFDDGRVAWQHRSVGKGSLVYADERLYLLSERGVVGLAEATPDGYRERGRFRIQGGSSPTWTHPIVAGGRLYLRDQDTVYAYDIRLRSSEITR